MGSKSSRKNDYFGLSLLKIVMVLIGIIIIGAYISNFVKNNVWYFAGVAIVSYIIILKRVFK